MSDRQDEIEQKSLIEKINNISSKEIQYLIKKITFYLLGTIIISIILNLAASWLFWKYMLNIKPDILASPIVLKGKSRSDNRKIYRIKIINKGDRQIKDVELTASLLEIKGTLGIDHRRSPVRCVRLNDKCEPLKVTITNNQILGFGAKEEIYNVWGLSVMLIVTIEIKNENGEDFDLESILTDERRLVLTISATDALSGTTILQRYSYTKDKILQGDFKRNLNFDYLPEDAQVFD